MRGEEPHFEFALIGEGGHEQGFSDTNISQFSGNPPYYVARESIQNICDAKDSSSRSPVMANFDVLNIKMKDLPGWLELKQWVKDASEFEGNISMTRARNFYQKALDLLDHGERFIQILKIEDKNTKGMSGNDKERGGDCYKFFNPGVTSKESGGGGSYGIGKMAFYAASQLRLIYASSVYDKGRYMFKGAIRLNTIEKNKTIYQDTGSFGMNGQKAVKDYEDIPEVFRRKEKGTSIYIVCFNGSISWKRDITESVLQNFWPAIYDEKLIVNISQDITLNKQNLERVMKEYFNGTSNDTEGNNNPLPFFKAYIDAEPLKANGTVLGTMKLYTIRGENYNSRIAYMRSTGMIIYRNSKYPAYKHMSVFQCDDKDGNELLRNMEDPTHSKWEVEYVDETDENLKERAKLAKNDISEFLRSNLTYTNENDENEIVEIPGLNDLSITGVENLSKQDTASYGIERDDDLEKTFETGHEENAITGDIHLIKPIKPISVHPKPLNPPKPEPHTRQVELTYRDYRCFSASLKGKTVQVVKFHKSLEPGINLSIYGATDNGIKKLDVKNASYNEKPLPTTNNIIRFSYPATVSKGGELKVVLKDRDKYSLVIYAYVNI